MVVEAVQYTGTVSSYKELKSFCGDRIVLIYDETIGELPTILTLEGAMSISEGDYIIKGVNGEFYPCKQGIFERTYEKDN